MKHIAAYLTFIMFLLFLTAPVFGAVKTTETASSETASSTSTTEGKTSSHIRIFDQYEASPDDENELILFFSDAKIGANHKGNVYVFFGNVHLQEQMEGTVYTFSSVVTYAEDAAPNIEPIIGLLSFVSNTSLADGVVTYSDVVPWQVLLLFWVIAETLICMMIHPIKPGFIEQGGVLLFREPVNVLRNGMTAYFFCIALMFVFGLTVFLLPVSLGVLAVMQGMIWVGEVALAVAAGWWLSARVLRRRQRHGYTILALILIGVVKCIPVVSVPFTYLILPVVSLGLMTTSFINGWVNRRYYETPFRVPQAKKAIDISAVRGIIMDERK